MATAFESEVVVFRTPDEVWAVLTDWERAHEWMRGIEKVTASGPTRAGTTLAFRGGGRVRPAELTVVDPGRCVVIRSVQGRVRADYRYELEPSRDGFTRLTLTATCTAGGAWVLVSPLLRRALRRSDADQLEVLKDLVGG